MNYANWVKQATENTLVFIKHLDIAHVLLGGLVFIAIAIVLFKLSRDSEISFPNEPPLVDLAIVVEEKASHYDTLNKMFEIQLESFINKSLNEVKKDMEIHNEKFLCLLLTPLKQDIEQFREQVNKAYLYEAQERSSLKNQIDTLKSASELISKEAFKLSKALTGDIKSQGVWGELVLENVLNSAGLRKGHEYSVQVSLDDNEYGKIRPDVIVHLPNNKNIVIDSKVSLTNYELYIRAGENKQGLEYLKKHLTSLYNHVNSLSSKKYETVVNNTVDFVLMFVPIESSFIVAMQYDADLTLKALNKKIIIVSPTTLLAALKTIDSVWGHYNFNKNIEKIAEQNSKVLNKALESLKTIDTLGKQVEKLNKSYESLVNKVSSGNTSLLSQIKKLIALSGAASMVDTIADRFTNMKNSDEDTNIKNNLSPEDDDEDFEDEEYEDHQDMSKKHNMSPEDDDEYDDDEDFDDEDDEDSDFEDEEDEMNYGY